MDDDMNYWFVRADGAFEVACSSLCYDIWCESGLITGRATRWPAGAYPLALMYFCVTCRVCGLLVHAPVNCLVHGSNCATPSWLLSLTAVEFAVEFSYRGELSGEGWEMAESIADHEPELNGEEIAYLVHRRLQG